MFEFNITPDKKWLKLTSNPLNIEKDQLISYFKRKNSNFYKKNENWDGFSTFITKDDRIKIGLWKEVYRFLDLYGYEGKINGLNSLFNEIDKDSYIKWTESIFKGITDEYGNPVLPRKYQVEGSYRALKYKKSTQELATSAGKTLIFYLFNSFLKQKGEISKYRKSILIVPNISLVNQTADKFKLYSNNSWKLCLIGGENKFNEETFKESEIVISTYQSLQNWKPAQFKQFYIVNIDECHKSASSTINTIIRNCVNGEYVLGLSGTVKLEEDIPKYFKVQESVGSLVMTLSAKYLIENGFAPNICINPIKFKYDQKEPLLIKLKELKRTSRSMFNDAKDYGRAMLEIEKNYIFESEARLIFIHKFIQKLKSNSLILFSDIKNGYGKKIYNKIKETNPNTFYIDGETPAAEREKYIKILEEKEEVTLVCSYGTFATGIDSKKLFHIILAESIKAEITLRQAIGRGMRLFFNKKVTNIWDLIDVIDGRSYSLKHYKKRLEIYINQEFTLAKERIFNLF